MDGTSIVGESPDGGLVQGMEYRFIGEWIQHVKYGQQFRFKQAAQAEPLSRNGVIVYLRRNASGIGSTIAGRLWDAFKQDAVRTLRTEPQRASSLVKGLSLSKAQQASHELQGIAALEESTIAVTGILDGYGFPHKLATHLVTIWGSGAAARIRRNPYVLVANHLPGCGFKRVDRLYCDLNKDQPVKLHALKRQAMCAWHAIKSDTSGHTWFDLERVYAEIVRTVDASQLKPSKALELLRRAKWLAVKQDASGKYWIADRDKARAETYVAEKLYTMLICSTPLEWPDLKDGLSNDLSEHQEQQVVRALQNRVSVLCGSPGTGKTFATAQIISKLLEKFGAQFEIGIAAPTGKAAVRCTSSLRASGIDNIEASTIHRLLGIGFHGGQMGFQYNSSNPMPYKYVVIDEASMLDISLFASLLQACRDDTHLFLVGDPYQLPPVGNGAPLRDLLASGLAYGELTEIHRNAGDVVRACVAIKDGKPWVASDTIDIEAGKNLKHIERHDAAGIVEALKQTITTIKAKGFNPATDVQVLAVVNSTGELSRCSLNTVLQSLINPDGRRLPGNAFRERDKVIILKNTFLKSLPKNEQVFCANGEIGIVDEIIDKSAVMVKLTNPDRLVNVSAQMRDDDDADNAGLKMDWAYAITTHKSQGSGFPIVIIILDDSSAAAQVATRELLFTAMSRTEQLCITIGPRVTADKWCRKIGAGNRKTFLASKIKDRLNV